MLSEKDNCNKYFFSGGEGRKTCDINFKQPELYVKNEQKILIITQIGVTNTEGSRYIKTFTYK